MSDQTKRVLWRLGRGLFYGVVGAAITFAIQHYTELPINPIYYPILGAIFQAIDKWVRDQHAQE